MCRIMPVGSTRICRLRPLTFLPPSEPRAPFLAGFHGLTRDDRRPGRWVASHTHTRLFAQGRLHALPGASVAPETERAPDGGPSGKVVRQGPPLASGAIPGEERVEDLTPVRRTRTPAGFGRRDQRFQDRPFLLGEIAGGAARWAFQARLLPPLPLRNRLLVNPQALRGGAGLEGDLTRTPGLLQPWRLSRREVGRSSTGCPTRSESA